MPWVQKSEKLVALELEEEKEEEEKWRSSNIQFDIFIHSLDLFLRTDECSFIQFVSNAMYLVKNDFLLCGP